MLRTGRHVVNAKIYKGKLFGCISHHRINNPLQIAHKKTDPFTR